ncbi:MAG TPA: DNA repair protein RadC [Luteolibacter sp.]|nr:DNA repair protein RadC [Luteolibacter sp.]
MQSQHSDPVKMRIRDLPMALRPREKWLQAGAGALDNAELLALFIASGTRGHSAIDIGRELLSRHGSLAALGALSASQLAEEPGMGLAKASRLAAAFELAARVSREQLADLILDSPDRIHRSYAPQLQHLPHEQVVVVAVDSRMRHLGTTIVSMGSVTESIAHPREILRPVITRGAHGFILLHNHPSGDPSPSRADCEVTKRIAEAANLMQLRFIDHLIIGRPLSGRLPYHSFREAGLIP